MVSSRREPYRGLSTAAGLLLALLLLSCARLPAQTPLIQQPVDSGTVIRFHAPSGVITGRLTARLAPGDSLARFCLYHGPPCDQGGIPVGLRTIAIDSVFRLEVQRGSRWRRGAIIGGVIGAAAGGGFGSFAAGMCESTPCPSQLSGIVAGGLSGALFIGGIGALIGSAFPRW